MRRVSVWQVKLAERADGAIFAIKCLNRSRIVMASQGCRLAKEIRLLKMLNHPNVIRLHEVLHTPTEVREGQFAHRSTRSARPLGGVATQSFSHAMRCAPCGYRY